MSVKGVVVDGVHVTICSNPRCMVKMAPSRIVVLGYFGEVFCSMKCYNHVHLTVGKEKEK